MNRTRRGLGRLRSFAAGFRSFQVNSARSNFNKLRIKVPQMSLYVIVKCPKILNILTYPVQSCTLYLGKFNEDISQLQCIIRCN